MDGILRNVVERLLAAFGGKQLMGDPGGSPLDVASSIDLDRPPTQLVMSVPCLRVSIRRPWAGCGRGAVTVIIGSCRVGLGEPRVDLRG